MSTWYKVGSCDDIEEVEVEEDAAVFIYVRGYGCAKISKQGLLLFRELDIAVEYLRDQCTQMIDRLQGELREYEKRLESLNFKYPK